jgi:hypothetical protein
MPPHPSTDSGGAWSFEFPSVNAGHVNYIQTPFNITAAPQSVSLTFRVESVSAQYSVLDPSDIPPATIHIFIEQRGDDLVSANGRWWAQASGYNLGSKDNETITIDVPFASEEWSNVYGQSDASAFSEALKNVGWIGLTCGGQYFWGHGVALRSGNSKFVLIDFHVS